MAPVTIHLGVHSDILITNADHTSTTRRQTQKQWGPGALSYLILHHNLARWRLLLALPLQNPEVQRSDLPSYERERHQDLKPGKPVFFLKKERKSIDTHSKK